MYTIEMEGEKAFILTNDGHYLPPEEYNNISNALRRGKIIVEKNAAIQRASEIIDTIQWIFPTKRSDIYASGRCVYFLHDTKTNWIKIGCTVNLANRSKKLQRNIGNRDAYVIAFFKTHEYRKDEKAMHALFREAHIKGEWFAWPPVMRFLDGKR